jgi:hypothetical protein
MLRHSRVAAPWGTAPGSGGAPPASPMCAPWDHSCTSCLRGMPGACRVDVLLHRALEARVLRRAAGEVGAGESELATTDWFAKHPSHQARDCMPARALVSDPPDCGRVICPGVPYVRAAGTLVRDGPEQQARQPAACRVADEPQAAVVRVQPPHRRVGAAEVKSVIAAAHDGQPLAEGDLHDLWSQNWGGGVLLGLCDTRAA